MAVIDADQVVERGDFSRAGTERQSVIRGVGDAVPGQNDTTVAGHGLQAGGRARRRGKDRLLPGRVGASLPFLQIAEAIGVRVGVCDGGPIDAGEAVALFPPVGNAVVVGIRDDDLGFDILPRPGAPTGMAALADGVGSRLGQHHPGFAGVAGRRAKYLVTVRRHPKLRDDARILPCLPSHISRRHAAE